VRRPREIIVLLALLVAAMAFVLGYVVHRKAGMRAAPPPPAAVKGPVAPVRPPDPAPVDLTKPDRQIVDFSSGKPVLKDSPEDRAALEAGLKDIAEATRDLRFEAPKAEPPQR